MAAQNVILDTAIKLQKAGHLDEAEAVYRQLVSNQPLFADAWHLLGLCLFQKQELDQALMMVQTALELDRDNPAFLDSLGLIHVSSGAVQSALPPLLQSIERDPNRPKPYIHLGDALKILGRWDDAATAYQMALERDRTSASAWNGLGNIRVEQNRLVDAVDCYRETVALLPGETAPWINLGRTLADLGDLDGSDQAFFRARELNPKDAELFVMWGAVLHENNRSDEALTAYQRALQINPTHARAYYNLGNVLRDTGRDEAAIEAFNAAEQIAPNDPRPRFNRSLIHLQNGDGHKGWPDYESRFQLPALKSLVFPDKVRRWQGEDLAGKILLLVCEQGAGDAIMMSRYFSALSQKAKKLIVRTPQALERLFGQIQGVEICSEQVAFPEHDYWLPVMSLPYILQKMTLEIETSFPYLRAAIPVREPLRLTKDQRPIIALVWAGNPDHENDRNRSIPIQDLEHLLEFPAQWISLQVGKASHHCPAQMANVGALLTDFADTAAVLGQVDLLVSVDTAIVHLAGALSVPVALLLPFLPDWRWGKNGSETVWYPTISLFRQERPRHWQTPLAELIKHLRSLS